MTSRRTAWEAGDVAKAAHWAERIEALRDRLDPPQLAGLGEREALAYLETRHQGDSILVSAALAAGPDRRAVLVDQVWRRVLESRHRVFDELTLRRAHPGRERRRRDSRGVGRARSRTAPARDAVGVDRRQPARGA